MALVTFETLPAETRAVIVSAHPRPDFRRRILHAFRADPAHRPQSTFGNTKADAPDHCEDHYTRPNFVRIIKGSLWPG